MKSRSLLIAIGLSLLVHIGSLLGLSIADYRPTTKPSVSEKVVIELLDSELGQQFPTPRKEPNQIVEQSEEALNDEVPEDTKYLSRHNQRVVEETRAAKRGTFQNDGGKGLGKASQTLRPMDLPTPPKAKETKDVAKDKVPQPALQDLMPGYKFQARQKQETEPKRAPAQEPQVAGNGRMQSQSSDHLPDMKVGPQTLLNTREFVYYSYYQRIRQQLSQQWEPLIKQKLREVYRSGRTVASDVNRVTRVMIVLDDAGTLIGVQIVSASGLHDIDEAAVEAFRAAAPFPNPPQEIVDPDGTIKIRWDFILEA